jgi:hypothetical protein
MKRYIIAVLVILGVAGAFIGKGYGTEPMMEPPNRGADPTAILLVEQGIKQFNGQEVKAARDSFELAAQIDPTLSSASVNARLAAQEMSQNPSARDGGANAVGGGFAEFGVATLAGFIFVFVMAAYDFGGTHPSMGSKEKAFFERVPQQRPWAVAA